MPRGTISSRSIRLKNRGFVDRFHAAYSPQRVVTDPMEAAYIGVKLWAKAVEQAKTDDAKVIREAILGQKMLAPEGEVHIDDATRHTYKTPRIGQIEDEGPIRTGLSGSQTRGSAAVSPVAHEERLAAVSGRSLCGLGRSLEAPEE